MFWRGARQKASSGTYHSSGLNATVGSNSGAIEIEFTSGTVYVNGSEVSVPSTTVTLADGPASPEMRVDAIYADGNGNLQVESGVPAEPAPTTDGTAYSNGGTPYPFRQLWNPAEPDAEAFTGVPLVTVLVPDGATASTDIGSSDVREYSLAASKPGAHTHPDIALNQRTEFLSNASTAEYVKLATINDGSGGGHGDVRITLWRGSGIGNQTPRLLDVEVNTASGSAGVRANAYGARASATDIIVTEEAAADAGTTQNRHHLYAYLPNGSRAMAKMQHSGPQFGDWEYVADLASNDLVGTIIHDTGDSATGGEVQIPKAPSSVRADVEGITDVADLVSGASASAGNLPVAQSDGSVAWTDVVHTSGEWEEVGTHNFVNGSAASEYTTTQNDFASVCNANQGIPIPFAALNDSKYDTLGISLVANLSTDTAGSSAEARLGTASSGTNHIGGTIISSDTGEYNPVNSGIATVSFAGPQRIFLEMRSDGTATAKCAMATVRVWGRMA